MAGTVPPGWLPRQPLRHGSRRDRRGRGQRGPRALPGPLTPGGPPLLSSPAGAFDQLVLDLVQRLEQRLPDELADIEFGVEDLPPDDVPGGIPLAAAVPAAPGRSARVVLFRRPIELRAAGRAEQSALVSVLLAENVAELLGKDPADIDPRYDG